MQRTRLLLLGAAAISLWGCGGGSGTSTPTNNSLTRATAQLNQLASGQITTSDTTLQSALTLFQQAVQQNPNSPEARFGLAVCQAGLVAQQIDGTNSSSGSTQTGTAGVALVSSATGSSDTGIVPPAPPQQTGTAQALPPHHTLGLLWNLNNGISNPDTLLHMLAPVADLRFGLMAYNGYGSDDVTTHQKMLADLTTVTQTLSALEANSAFTTTLSGPHGKTFTVGLPEVYLFDAYVNSLRAEIALSLAYVRATGATVAPGPPVLVAEDAGGRAIHLDYRAQSGHLSRAEGGAGASSGSGGSPTITSPIYVNPFTGLDTNKDGQLTPSEYLPASPFLTLRDATLLQTAQQALVNVADRETNGINGIFARPTDGSGGFLIPNSAAIHTALNETLTQVVPTLQQAATGPVTLKFPRYLPISYGGGVAVPLAAQGKKAAAVKTTGRGVFEHGGQVQGVSAITGAPSPFPLPAPIIEKVTINLAAWFAAPPADLKVFAPTYTLDANGFPNFGAVTYPDPTFGGLFPNGLPQDFLL